MMTMPTREESWKTELQVERERKVSALIIRKERGMTTRGSRMKVLRSHCSSSLGVLELKLTVNCRTLHTLGRPLSVPSSSWKSDPLREDPASQTFWVSSLAELHHRTGGLDRRYTPNEESWDYYRGLRSLQEPYIHLLSLVATILRRDTKRHKRRYCTGKQTRLEVGQYPATHRKTSLVRSFREQCVVPAMIPPRVRSSVHIEFYGDMRHLPCLNRKRNEQ